LNIRLAHWANHVRPQRWAKNPPGKKERRKKDRCGQGFTDLNVGMSCLDADSVAEMCLSASRLPRPAISATQQYNKHDKQDEMMKWLE